MHRPTSTLLFFSWVGALCLGAMGCAPDDGRDHRDERATDDPCAEALSCGACTPIVGCGWCSGSDGSGKCASSPARCTGSKFTWTWEPTGCSGAIDSGVRVSDAAATEASPATDAAVSDAKDDDASESASDASPAVDSSGEAAVDSPADSSTDSSSDASAVCRVPAAASSPCVLTSGGSLCKTSQYTLACHAGSGAEPAPDPVLACARATTVGDATFYCCPCGAE